LYSDFKTSSSAEALGPNAIRDLLSLLQKPEITSFAGGMPDPAFFPRERIREALKKATQDAPLDVFQYGATQGHHDLRSWIAADMAERGVPCEPENILVTSGSQQGLDLSTRLLVDPGDAVMVSDPSYLGALQIFRARGAKLSTADQSIPEKSRIAMAYVVTDHSNPTGYSMTLGERENLLAKALSGRFAIVEDGAYCELGYDGGSRAPSIMALDCRATGSIERTRTLYCGTFSKVLVPALRIGWICASRRIIDMLVRQKGCADLLTSPISQAATYNLLRDGFKEHVEELRRVYGARRDAMVSSLQKHVPRDIGWSRPAGGMFVWLTLPENLDADELLPTAMTRHLVAFVPGRSFIPNGLRKNCLRLSFCQYSEDRIVDGVRRLGELLNESISEGGTLTNARHA
jgi:DNA-binding transcriptional MocR family regulator